MADRGNHTERYSESGVKTKLLWLVKLILRVTLLAIPGYGAAIERATFSLPEAYARGYLIKLLRSVRESVDELKSRADGWTSDDVDRLSQALLEKSTVGESLDRLEVAFEQIALATYSALGEVARHSEMLGQIQAESRAAYEAAEERHREMVKLIQSKPDKLVLALERVIATISESERHSTQGAVHLPDDQDVAQALEAVRHLVMASRLHEELTRMPWEGRTTATSSQLQLRCYFTRQPMSMYCQAQGMK
jgi:hypothetical protein